VFPHLEARSYFSDALRVYDFVARDARARSEDEDEDEDEASVPLSLGIYGNWLGQHAAALAHFETAERLAGLVGDRGSQSHALTGLGSARDYWERAIERYPDADVFKAAEIRARLAGLPAEPDVPISDHGGVAVYASGPVAERVAGRAAGGVLRHREPRRDPAVPAHSPVLGNGHDHRAGAVAIRPV
jgi:hypothetical protein